MTKRSEPVEEIEVGETRSNDLLPFDPWGADELEESERRRDPLRSSVPAPRGDEE